MDREQQELLRGIVNSIEYSKTLFIKYRNILSMGYLLQVTGALDEIWTVIPKSVNLIKTGDEEFIRPNSKTKNEAQPWDEEDVIKFCRNALKQP